MKSSSWCPLSQKECREDCAWADVIVEIDDEGITKEVYCAVTMIAARFITDEDIVDLD